MTEKEKLDFQGRLGTLAASFKENPEIFQQTKATLEKFINSASGAPSFDNQKENALSLIDTMLDKAIFPIIDTFYLQITRNTNISLTGFDETFISELTDFANFVCPIMKNTIEEHRATVRQASVALKTFKAALLSKPTKSARILSDWVTKWSSYIQRESTFRPRNLKSYKQREIILVDFGFNVDGEFGGRHYAVVLERNNPNANTVFVAPITSYDPMRGQKPHPANIDLGIGAIHGYHNGAEVVTNQIRYISKMRIESPKTSAEPRIYMAADKFSLLVDKITKQIQFS